MDTEEQPTCGQGLAENSALPSSLGNVISGVAEHLSEHMKALAMQDAEARTEYDAYERLVGQLRQVAAELHASANEMAGYHDLPMGRCDQAAMTQPAIREAFENFVHHKQELATLLENTTARDAQLLQTLRSHGK